MDSLLVSSVVVGRDWSHLPNDLLLPILQRLEICVLLRSAVVSTSWRSAAAELRRLRLPSRYTTPWLVACGGDFYSLSDDKVYTISLPNPPICRRSCKGSSHGWLITCNDRAELQLLNPITRVQIDLPSVSTLFECIPFCRNYDNIYEKAVLSSSPSEGSNYIVAIIHRPAWVISLARAGDREWTTLPRPRNRYSYYHDCVFHGFQLYAVMQIAQVEVWVWDLEDENWESQQPKIVELEFESIESNIYYQFPYLVWTPWGDLLLVWRTTKKEDGGGRRRRVINTNTNTNTESVKVYKMDLERQRLVEVEVESIGDHALFLGSNQSLCLSCKDLPMLNPNSVYLLNKRGKVGVYSLKGVTFRPICLNNPCLGWPLSIWLTPRF